MKILSPEKAHLGGAAVALTATSGGTLAFPHFAGKIMDGFAQSSASSEVWLELVNSNAIGCLAALSIVGIGGFTRAYLLETASERIARRLRLGLFDSLLTKSQSFFDATKTGDLVSRLGTDVTRVSRSIMDGAFGFRVFINATAGTLMVSKLVPLTVVPQLLAPVVAMFVGGVVYGRFVRSASKRQSEAQARSMEIAEENLSLIRVVKLFSGETKSRVDYGKSLDAVYSLAQSNALATGGRVAAFVTIGGGFILHVIYNCGMLISTGALTVGQTSALAGYLLVCGNAYQGLVTAYGDIQKALGACERVMAVMNPEDPSAKLCPTSMWPVEFQGSSIPTPPSINFQGIHFGYSEGKKILNGLNMHVPAGAKQAVVGLSGCGKSSLLMLLAKLYRPTSGTISIGNACNIDSIDSTYLRQSLLSVVPQETALFNTSIRENVWYPGLAGSASLEKKISLSAQLSFVNDWDSLVGERGQNLSGGERQRIAIARALAKDCPILLLDEATSALDRESDAIVLSHLNSNAKKTILAVTHRMSAIEWSDRLSVLADGVVVQEGSTADLLKRPGPVLQRLLAQIHSVS